MDSVEARETAANLTNWEESPAPPPGHSPAAFKADAARPQPFLHVIVKAITLAKQAHEAELASGESNTEHERFTAFMDGLTDERFADVRAFLAWAAEAAGDEPGRDLAGFVRRFTKRLVREPVRRWMWDGALYRPRNFAKDAHRAVYWVSQLGIDIERVFSAPRGNPESMAASPEVEHLH